MKMFTIASNYDWYAVVTTSQEASFPDNLAGSAEPGTKARETQLFYLYA
jgi:hypothetical protein